MCAHDPLRERIEDRLAGVQPHARRIRFRLRLRPANAQAPPRLRRIAFKRRKECVESPRAPWREGEEAVEISPDFEMEQSRALLHEAPYVAGQKLEIALAIEVAPQPAEALRDLTGSAFSPPIGAFLPFLDPPYPIAGEPALEAVADAPLTLVGQRLDHVLPERGVFEEPADHVEHLVGAEFLADRVQLVEQHLEHSTLVGASRDEIHDMHVVALPVAVDAAHALLEPSRIPGDVVVHHQPAELEVDPLARGIGRYEVARAAGTAEELDLLLAFLPSHAAVDLRHPTREAEAFQTADEVVHRIAVLAEDEPLLARVARVFEHLAQLLELGFAAGVEEPPRPRAHPPERLELPLQLVDGDRDHRPEHRILVVLVPLAGSVFMGVFVRTVDVEEVVPMDTVEPMLPAPQLRRAGAARAQIVDAPLDLRDPTLEGAQQRERRACEPALEDAHREPHRGAVVERAAIGMEDVGGGRVVERLLAVRPGGEVVAERAAFAVRIERTAVETHHLLLGPADEVALAGRPGESTERLPGREHLRVEQPPEEVVGRVPAHVRRRGEQEQVPHRPTETAEAAGRGGAAGKRFREFVAPRQVDASALGGGAQLVRLVEDREIVGRHARIAQRFEHPLTDHGVDRHDHEVARRSPKRVAGPSVRSGDDAELQAEQGAKLPLPIADQTGWRDDKHPPESPARQHLAHIEAGHDGLARSRVVRQQEAEGVLSQHSLVDRNALVGERIDARGLACEGGVELVPVGEAQGLRSRGDSFRIPGEVERRRSRRRGRRGRLSRRILLGQLALQLPQTRQCKPARTRLTGLPAVNRDRGDPNAFGELDLSETHVLPNAPHALARIQR